MCATPRGRPRPCKRRHTHGTRGPTFTTNSQTAPRRGVNVSGARRGTAEPDARRQGRRDRAPWCAAQGKRSRPRTLHAVERKHSKVTVATQEKAYANCRGRRHHGMAQHGMAQRAHTGGIKARVRRLPGTGHSGSTPPHLRNPTADTPPPFFPVLHGGTRQRASAAGRGKPFPTCLQPNTRTRFKPQKPRGCARAAAAAAAARRSSVVRAARLTTALARLRNVCMVAGARSASMGADF